ncbi:Unannotated, partial [Lentimonas sp. CC4]
MTEDAYPQSIKLTEEKQSLRHFGYLSDCFFFILDSAV